MIDVKYHRDGYGPARPAINVKLHVAGIDYWPESIDFLGDDVAAQLVETAYDETAEQFWADAEHMARELCLGKIEQQGRSGGWLVLTDGPGYDMEALALADRTPDHGPRWIDGYSKLSTWANGFLADAPRMVRERARSLAIDYVAANAAHRMFGRAA